MAGQVYIDEVKAEKAGAVRHRNRKLSVRGESCPFVSRGGYKLQKAMEDFPISLEGTVAADIGASTGGFTDCMLQHGAKKVYAIDVGYGQLDWSLRSDERVVFWNAPTRGLWNQSGLTNRSTLHPSTFRLSRSIKSCRRCLLPQRRRGSGGARQPQFEAGRNKVGKNGVVTDEETHLEVVERMTGVALSADFA
jgi:23S rRNA (cytidine1920-2'-O)/16S rRNA (cytidine1409-2'-O)-methyltransferase